MCMMSFLRQKMIPVHTVSTMLRRPLRIVQHRIVYTSRHLAPLHSRRCKGQLLTCRRKRGQPGRLGTGGPMMLLGRVSRAAHQCTS